MKSWSLNPAIDHPGGRENEGKIPLRGQCAEKTGHVRISRCYGKGDLFSILEGQDAGGNN